MCDFKDYLDPAIGILRVHGEVLAIPDDGTAQEPCSPAGFRVDKGV